MKSGISVIEGNSRNLEIVMAFWFRTATPARVGGFTLIELMIVLAIIAIIFTLALPVYSNYAIRAKLGEGLSLASSAVTSVSASCVENPALTSLTNQSVGYNFSPGSLDTNYVENVQVTGSCSAPLITVTSRMTGQSPDPVLVLSGRFAPDSGQINWACTSSNTPNWLLPNSCRS